MAWGDKVASTQLTSVTSTEQFFSQTPQLSPGETAHVEIELNPVTSPTDNLVVSVYGTLDTSTQSWDEVALFSFEIDKGTDPNKASFKINDVFSFRVGVKAAGGTDTHTSVDMNHRVNGISA